MSPVSAEWYDLGALKNLEKYEEPTIPEDGGSNHSLDVAGKGGPGRLENWGPVKAAAVTEVVLYVFFCTSVFPVSISV